VSTSGENIHFSYNDEESERCHIAYKNSQNFVRIKGGDVELKLICSNEIKIYLKKIFIVLLKSCFENLYCM
jgi:hypothetical protein